MKKNLDIYNTSGKVKRATDRVKNSDISERNKRMILDFKDFARVDGIGEPRIERYLWSLKDMALILKVDFDKATKEDIVRLVSAIQSNERHSPSTKQTYKKMLKRFYKWVKDSPDASPEEVKWIKTTLKLTEKNLPANAELITEKEVQKLIDVAEHPRDKAFVSVLYESGARIGEIASLQLCNVKFDEYGVVLHVEGKTGARPIRIISSTPYLTTWIQSHPLKDDHQAALWVNIGTTKHNNPLKYSTIQCLLRRLFSKANIKKRCNPHMFRHSRATFLADHLTEFQMNQYFGWIQGSNMPSTYVHMSGVNIDSSILELNGIKNPTVSKESSLKPKICPRCSMINANNSKFCNKCAGILDINTAYELDHKVKREAEIRKTPDDLMNTLMKDPEFLQMFMNKVKEIGLGANTMT